MTAPSGSSGYFPSIKSFWRAFQSADRGFSSAEEGDDFSLSELAVLDDEAFVRQVQDHQHLKLELQQQQQQQQDKQQHPSSVPVRKLRKRSGKKTKS